MSSQIGAESQGGAGEIETGLAALRRSPEFRGPVDPLDDHDHVNDHLALIYESREEQFAAAVPYIRQGLERGERCVYITHENSRGDVEAALREGGVDVDAALESGALSIHDERETYLRTGAFDAEDTLAFLDDAIAEAGEAYEALRVTGEMSFILGDDPAVDELLRCESKANYLFEDVDGMALCQYNRDRFPPEVIRDVINTHPHLVHGQSISRNSYYAPPSEFLGPERPASEVDRMLGTLRDQTDAKAELEETVEQLRQSNDRLQQFAYAASHDLQEPLRMVSSYLQLLENRYGDELDETAREYIDYAVDGADRMRAMVDDLLAYSRVERADGEFEPVDCAAVVEAATDDLRVQIEESDAEIAVGSLPTVTGDGEQLEQLFRNLVSNAVKYSGEGPPRVEITAEERSDHWEFAVADEGIGIDPAKTDRIFEVFKRLHNDEEYSGTGIGLSLCQEIAENHGGDIRVESEPGEGSTFFVTIPKPATD